MTFLDILKEMVDGLDGADAGTVMGMDGISVQDYVREGIDCDLETIGVEYGKLIDEIKKASEVLSLGDVEEVIISLKDKRILLRPATPEYFVALVIAGDSNVGKARYRLKRAVVKAREELLR